jgi:hypothetical protein
VAGGGWWVLDHKFELELALEGLNSCLQGKSFLHGNQRRCVVGGEWRVVGVGGWWVVMGQAVGGWRVLGGESWVERRGSPQRSRDKHRRRYPAEIRMQRS